MAIRAMVWMTILVTWALAGAVDTTHSATVHGIGVAGQLGGGLRAVAVDGTRLYVGRGPRLVMVDASDPDELVELGTSQLLPGSVWRVAAGAGQIFVALITREVLIFEPAADGSLIGIGSFEVEGSVNRMLVDGQRLYVGGSHFGLHIYDIADPGLPHRIGGFPYAPVVDLVIDGTRLYAAVCSGGVLVLDLSAGSDPRLLARRAPGTGCAFGVAVRDRMVFLVNDALHVLDASQDRSLQPVTMLEDIGLPSSRAGVDAGLLGGQLLIADVFAGLIRVDVSRPDQPRLQPANPLPGLIQMALQGSMVWMVTSQGRLLPVDFSNPIAPRPLDGLRSVPGLQRIIPLPEADLAVAIDGDCRVLELALAFPKPPRVIGRSLARVAENPVCGAEALLMQRRWLIGLVVDELSVFDLGTTEGPQRIAGLTLPERPLAMVLEGHQLYFMGGEGVHRVDLSDPARPSHHFVIDRPYERTELAIDSGTLWLLERPIGRGSRLLAIDVAIVGQARLVGGSILEDDYHHFAVADALGYLLGSELRIFDLSDARAARAVGSVEFGEYGLSEPSGLVLTSPRQLFLFGVAYPRDRNLSRLLRIDAKRLDRPMSSQGLEVAGIIDRVAIEGSQVVIRTQADGHYLLQLESGWEFGLPIYLPSVVKSTTRITVTQQD